MSGAPGFRKWSGAAIALLVLLIPHIALAPIGLAALWGGTWFWIWLGSSPVFIALSLLLWRRWRDRPRPPLSLTDEVDAAALEVRSELEKQAWAALDAVLARTDPAIIGDRAAVSALATETVETVAKLYRPNDKRPLLGTTLPELMLLSEQASRRIRRLVLEQVPLGDRVQLGHIARAIDFAPHLRHLDTANTLWRVLRVPINPVAALIGEARDRLMKEATDLAVEEVSRRLLAILVTELGRAAIDLYSGRLRLTAGDVAALQRREAQEGTERSGEAATIPKIALVGPSSAGKSSLLNALSGEVRAAVDILPETDGVTLHALTIEGRPTIHLLDTPGLDGTEAVHDQVKQVLKDADLCLWVLPANRPGLALERSLADELRAPGRRAALPERAVVTMVDRLPPFAEWSPPYDLAKPRGAKAESIAGSLDAVAESMGLDRDKLVWAVPAGRGDQTGISGVWDLIGAATDAALLHQAGRTAEAARGSGNLLRQVTGAVTGVWSALGSRSGQRRG